MMGEKYWGETAKSLPRCKVKRSICRYFEMSGGKSRPLDPSGNRRDRQMIISSLTIRDRQNSAYCLREQPKDALSRAFLLFIWPSLKKVRFRGKFDRTALSLFR